MANLRDFRTRINGVKNTRKITSAMKMVAAAKLRKAQKRAEDAQPYSARLNEILARAKSAVTRKDLQKIPLLVGHKAVESYLVIVVSAERGLCGAFNQNLLKSVATYINQRSLDGKKVQIVCIGRKGYLALKKLHDNQIISYYPLEETFQPIQKIMRGIIKSFDEQHYDEAHVFYNKFENAMKQTPERLRLIPYDIPEAVERNVREEPTKEYLKHQRDFGGWHEFEPNAAKVMEELIPAQIATTLYRIVLEVAAGEQAARMTAMDGASRNAKELIDDLTLTYNRMRQEAITSEVTEIVSAAQAI